MWLNKLTHKNYSLQEMVKNGLRSYNIYYDSGFIGEIVAPTRDDARLYVDSILPGAIIGSKTNTDTPLPSRTVMQDLERTTREYSRFAIFEYLVNPMILWFHEKVEYDTSIHFRGEPKKFFFWDFSADQDDLPDFKIFLHLRMNLKDELTLNFPSENNMGIGEPNSTNGLYSWSNIACEERLIKKAFALVKQNEISHDLEIFIDYQDSSEKIIHRKFKGKITFDSAISDQTFSITI